jgi:hypothetical protein
MNEFLHWLSTEAAAGWGLGIVSFSGLVWTLVGRKRPNRLAYSEIDKSSLIDINTKIRDRIKVTYNQQPIERLGHVRAEIYNEGSTTIHNATFTLRVSEPVRILEIAAVSSADGCQVACQSDERQATITASYVNPYRDHNHTLVVSMLVDGNIPKIEISGGGDGWSLRQARDQARTRPAIGIGFGLLTLGWLYAFLLYSAYVEINLKIPSREISGRSFVAALPALLSLGAIFFIFSLALRPRRPKTSQETLEKIRNA